MREQLGAYLDELAADDDIKVVLLRGDGGVFSTGADMANAYSWYGKDAAGENGRSPSAAAEPAAAAVRRPQDLRLLPQLPRLSEGDRRRGARLRARRRLRDGADGRHLRRRARHPGRDAGDALSRAGARLAPHVLLPARPDAGAPPAPHRRHASPRRSSSISRSSPRSPTTRPSRRARTGGPARWRGCPPTAS